MRIYSMTATFGKLEHQTLTLEPGLQIIHAPNEWGKSTWCAFLVAMLYGLDTRERTTKGSLANKDRFAPWSGSPMSGRIDLNWQGRDITIERRSKGRIPMGELTAYETATGIPVPELTAANCGQVLLGVERSVFVRAGFIRSSEMPVTQDEELRHRLNALVTTGDESLAAEALGKKLKDLKNSCRYNKSGLLPDGEAQRDAIAEKLAEFDSLTRQTQQLKAQQTELAERIGLLENHQAALNYEAAQENMRRVAQAEQALQVAQSAYESAQAACSSLPSRDEAMQARQNASLLRQQWDDLLARERTLPSPPQPPQPSPPFRGLTPEEAVAKAQADRCVMQQAIPSPKKAMLFLGLAGILAGIVLSALSLLIVGIPLMGLGAVMLLLYFTGRSKCRQETEKIRKKQATLIAQYGEEDPEQWIALALRYQYDTAQYEKESAAYLKATEELSKLRQQLAEQMQHSHSFDPDGVIRAWDTLEQNRQHLDQAQAHCQALQAMVKSVPPAPSPDELTCSAGETARLLTQAAAEMQSLQHRLGQCQGKTERLGSQEQLRQELESVETRIRNLELTYHALELGIETLDKARSQLQRRFAPRLTQQAQELFARLTVGRYERLTLAEDLSIHAGAQQEDTLRSHLWRSEGTVDQLYLALRLAVARELTPTAPLILDDALIRFDDTRLQAAMEILREEAQNRQVIIFTCQGREQEAQS